MIKRSQLGSNVMAYLFIISVACVVLTPPVV